MKNVFQMMEEQGSRQKMADFLVKQKQSYEFKKRYARLRAFEFVSQCDEKDMNYHVSVGGLDSITLYLFLHSIGIKAIGVSTSHLEDKSIQDVHKALGILRIKSAKKDDGTTWKKHEIIREFGFPVISKEIAAKVELLQNPSEKNKTVRHAIITGETGEYGGNQKNSRMKMPQKWLELFGGYENENEGVNYKKPNFKCSSKCCYFLKEKPCDDWAKEYNSVPFLGLMASEGGRREKSLKLHGCNYWGKTTVRSCPFAIFMRQDILHMAQEMDAWYHEHWQEFRPIKGADEIGNVIYGEPIHLDSIIPKIYGEIVADPRTEKEKQKLIEQKFDISEFDLNFKLRTTGAQRTGCSMCGFGIHKEKRPHRFDQLREKNEKEWDYLMNHICVDEDGNEYGWGRVLDYIGVPWLDEPVKQISFENIIGEIK